MLLTSMTMANNVDPAFNKYYDVWGFKTLYDHQKNALKYVIEKKKYIFHNLPSGPKPVGSNFRDRLN